jgi:selenocysteine-specific translation elongation factor
MGNLNVAVIAPPGYARDLGKMGTSSDITFYNLKKGEDTVTFIEPSRYPERLSSLYFAAAMAKRAIVVVDAITPSFGESVLMLQCLGIQEGHVILREYMTREELAPMIKGTVLEQYTFIKEDLVPLREDLLSLAARSGPREESALGQSSGSITVDHFFPVRGIGTVILGCVAKGAVKKHDTLRLLPGEKTVQVRSIQKHDDDYDWAAEGDRVGIALKNVDVEELDRGCVLSNDTTLSIDSSLTGRAHLLRYWQHPLREGMVLHIGHWMQFLPARVVSVKDDGDWRMPNVTLELEEPLVSPPKGRAVLHYLEGGKLRIAGTFSLP